MMPLATYIHPLTLPAGLIAFAFLVGGTGHIIIQPGANVGMCACWCKLGLGLPCSFCYMTDRYDLVRYYHAEQIAA